MAAGKRDGLAARAARDSVDEHSHRAPPPIELCIEQHCNQYMGLWSTIFSDQTLNPVYKIFKPIIIIAIIFSVISIKTCQQIAPYHPRFKLGHDRRKCEKLADTLPDQLS